jgi:predicted RNA-binding protein YlqC (UPF0109 family)
MTGVRFRETETDELSDQFLTNPMERDQQFLEQLVKALVDHPESVRINRTVDEMGVLLTLDVDAQDMGKIIGRSGNTAKAIRTLLRVVGMKNDARVNLKINEPEGGTRSGAMADATGDTVYDDEQPQSPKTLDEAIEGLRI